MRILALIASKPLHVTLRAREDAAGSTHAGDAAENGSGRTGHDQCDKDKDTAATVTSTTAIAGRSTNRAGSVSSKHSTAHLQMDAQAETGALWQAVDWSLLDQTTWPMLARGFLCERARIQANERLCRDGLTLEQLVEQRVQVRDDTEEPEEETHRAGAASWRAFSSSRTRHRSNDVQDIIDNGGGMTGRKRRKPLVPRQPSTKHRAHSAGPTFLAAMSWDAWWAEQQAFTQ